MSETFGANPGPDGGGLKNRKKISIIINIEVLIKKHKHNNIII